MTSIVKVLKTFKAFGKAVGEDTCPLQQLIFWEGRLLSLALDYNIKVWDQHF